MHRYVYHGEKANEISESPQWGSNSKVLVAKTEGAAIAFQSPQWGSNSKVNRRVFSRKPMLGFSPRNGEVILKYLPSHVQSYLSRFSPRNGEVILKLKLK